jgi:hypothetical protein
MHAVNKQKFPSCKKLQRSICVIFEYLIGKKIPRPIRISGAGNVACGGGFL